jgi:hypothetical protein
MKCHILILLGITIFALDIFGAADNSGTAPYARELDSPDALVCAKAIERLGRSACR